jgi:hypothetical protein
MTTFGFYKNNYMKTLLDLTITEAREYLLRQESYSDIDLPGYFTFNDLLTNLSKELSKSSISNNQFNSSKQLDSVNYSFLNNKDGKFAWRPLQLINPAMYVYLVFKITEERNWRLIIERFKIFQGNKNIRCCSIPVIKEEEKSDKANSIINWWHSFEQHSLELALEYDYFLNTDISDCYGSIYTHTIPWALHEKHVVKLDHSSERYIGNRIDTVIQSMSYGQTNGIPQGSILMDFIAEMVLGYADLLLTEKIAESGITNYFILRYRDDYRIFSNDEQTAKTITKLLTEILISLNLKLNPNKTFITNNIIKDSVKPDKLFWIGAKKGDKSLQKTLLLIHTLSEKHPNSGSLSRALDDFYRRIIGKKEFKNENIKVLVSIIVDITFKNPRIYAVSMAILSKLLPLIPDDAISIITSIENKFSRIPNVGHMLVWLQRLTLIIEPEKDYRELLCKKVINDRISIWNTDWLSPKLKKIIDETSIIDNKYISEMEGIIPAKEFQVFDKLFY